jgi:hypothetical protein
VVVWRAALKLGQKRPRSRGKWLKRKFRVMNGTNIKWNLFKMVAGVPSGGRFYRHMMNLRKWLLLLSWEPDNWWSMNFWGWLAGT